MSKRTGSLNPCKLPQHLGLKDLGNQDNNGKRETPSRESISSLPCALLCLAGSGSSLPALHTFKWDTGEWACTQTNSTVLCGFGGAGLIPLRRIQQTYLIKNCQQTKCFTDNVFQPPHSHHRYHWDQSILPIPVLCRPVIPKPALPCIFYIVCNFS